MSNEAEIINNPTSLPVSASTGFQRQNTRYIAQATGIDKTYVEGGADNCVLKISGPVDVNGTLYSIASDVDFSAAVVSGGAGRYIIYLDGTGDNLTPTLTQTAGTFDPAKNAHYTAGGKRILNWLITYDGTTVFPRRSDEECEDTWLTADGTWTAMFTKVYKIYVTGAGGDGGDATYAGGAFGGGGGGGLTGIKTLLINAGDIWTSIFSTTSGGLVKFQNSGPTISLESQNGTDGEDGDSGADENGGPGGKEVGSTGFDFYLGGQDGSPSFTSSLAGGVGGSSYYGGGGKGRHSSEGNGDGYDGSAYGGGGGGAYRGSTGSQSGGTGGPGVVRIIG